MKTNHDGDCTIYSALINGRPEDGICTCGYGLQQLRNTGTHVLLYSVELSEKLTKQNALEDIASREQKQNVPNQSRNL